MGATECITASGSARIPSGKDRSPESLGTWLLRLGEAWFTPIGEHRDATAYLLTAGSLVVTVSVYAISLGWLVSSLMVLLLGVHECGHIVASRHYGIRVTLPFFAPYVGALIELRDKISDPWKLAVIGLAGPVFGTVAALACYGLHCTGAPYAFAEAAFLSIGMNAFNLIPLGCLDGGHAVAAISRRIWILGWIMMAAVAWFTRSPIAWIATVVMIPSVIGLVRLPWRRSQIKVPAGRKVLVAFTHLGLILTLVSAGAWIYSRDILPAIREGKSHLVNKHSVQRLQVPKDDNHHQLTEGEHSRDSLGIVTKVTLFGLVGMV